MNSDEQNLAPIIGGNIQEVWLEAFTRLTQPGITSICPFSVTVTDITEELEEPMTRMRQVLDTALLSVSGGRTTHTVANTIFPISLWNKNAPREMLYRRFLENVWPSSQKCEGNKRGHYFHRMIAFDEITHGNQLEHVIETWLEHKNHRHSALQICIFDPKRDHTNSRQQGFPCLHQVCFTPLGNNGNEGLAVTGFYATQHIFTKAYGNYLGLIRLGHFVAKALGLKLKRMTCFAGVAKLGDKIKREDAQELLPQLIKAANTTL